MANSLVEEEEDLIDIKKITFLILKNWIFFVISIPVFLSIAYVYLRYSKAIYSVEARVLIRDENNGEIGTEDVLKNLNYFNSFKTLTNEVEMLKTYSLVDQTLSDLHQDIGYYEKGEVLELELYKKSPFIIEMDSNHVQLIQTPIFIKMKGESSFILSINKTNSKVFIPSNKKDNSFMNHGKYSKEYKIGELCETDFFKFKLIKSISTWEKDRQYYFFIKERDKVVRSYLKKININPTEQGSSILDIKINGEIVEKEIDFLNALTFNFINNDLIEKIQIAENTLKFIDVQIEWATNLLTDAEFELQKFKSKNNLVDIEITLSNSSKRLEGLVTKKAELEVKHRYFEYLLEYVENNQLLDNITAPSAIGINDPLLNNLIIKLNNLYTERSSTKYSLKKDNPILVMIDLKIDNEKKSLIENVKNIIKNSQIMVNDIDERIKDANVAMQDLPSAQRNLISIQRRLELNSHIYNFLLEKRAEIGIAKSSLSSENKILDEARIVSYNPISPRVLPIYIFALVAGFLLPFIYVLIINFFRSVVHSKEDISRITKQPILGVVGHNKTGEKLPLLYKPKSAISESIRSIRVNLQYIKNEIKTSKVIGITSAFGGEGKTFCGLNLAISLAQADNKVILISSDLRKPKLEGYLGTSNEVGLSGILIEKYGIDDVLQQTKIKGLDVLPSGPIPPNPAELIGNSVMKELIINLKLKYDYVIIDSPPVGLVADYLVISQYTDINLYLVRNNYTKLKSLELINELVTGDTILDNIYIIYNDVVKQGYYGYGYGGYGYGGYGYGYYSDDKRENFLGKLFNKIKKK